MNRFEFTLNFGSKEWYQEGKRHREDGPAIEWAMAIKNGGLMATKLQKMNSINGNKPSKYKKSTRRCFF